MDANTNPNVFDPYCIRINGTECTLCTNGYFVDENGSCSPLSLNCLDRDPNGKCLECLSGFVLVGSDCIKAIDKCAVYFNDGCSECVKGYYLKNGVCYQWDLTC